MRVLLANVTCNIGSTGKIVYDLYQQMRADGHTAAIAYGRGQRVEGENIYKFGLSVETYLHAGLTRLTGYTGCFSPLSTRRLLRFIDEFQPDVVNLHEMHAYFCNTEPLVHYLRRNGIKTVWTFHCEEMYTGKCGYAYNCTRYKDSCGRCPAVYDYPKSLLFDQTHVMWQAKKDLFQDWDVTIVTPSQWLADRVRGSFLANKRIEVIHNGIDTECVFYPHDAKQLREQYNFVEKKVVLAVMADIHNERKGGPMVLNLANQMPDLQFVIVGADKTERYSDNVLFVERLRDQQRLATWYSLADVFLICSKRENFPTTCIEALCCGLPIVGIDSGGTAETAPPPYGKFLRVGDALTSTDYTRLNTAIREQLAAGYVKRDVSQYGRKSYASSVMYKKYIALFGSLFK